MVDKKEIEELTKNLRIIPKEFCKSHDCDDYLFHGQARCFIGKCPYLKEEEK